MERRRIQRHAAVVIIAAVSLALLVVFVAFILPPLTAQTSRARDFPDFRARLVSRIPPAIPRSRISSGRCSSRPHIRG
jgi:predicted PurR-regulated permease PerM